jgi:hypothetical protein
MIRNRRRRVITALLAVLHLLFMQLAVASYRCPMASGPMGEVGFGASSAALDVSARLSPCTESMPARAMDPDRPNLCQAHCLADAQTNSNAELVLALGLALPGPPPAIFAGAGASTGRAQPPAPRPPSTAAPPLAIQHCCWRI